MSDSKSSFLTNFLLLAIVVLLGVIFWDLRSNKPESLTNKAGEETPILSTKVIWQEGSVEVAKGSDGWVKAVTNEAISEGTKIRTGQASRAILDIGNGLLRLNENTQIEAVKLDPANVLLIQDNGQTYHRVSVAKSGTYNVESLGQLITALGTAFDVYTDKTKEEVKVKVIESEVKVKVAISEKQNEEKTVKTGEEISITKKDSKEKVAKTDKMAGDQLDSDWYKWNKEEDVKKQYNLGALEQPAKEEAKASTSTVDVEKNKKDEVKPPVKPAETVSTPDSALQLTGEVKDEGVHLSWTPYTQDNYKYTKVLRSETYPNLKDPTEGYIYYSTDKKFVYYIDNSAKNGVTYYYRICVTLTSGDFRCSSVVKKVAATTVDFNAPQQPISAYIPVTGQLQLAVVKENTGMRLNWSIYTGTGFQYYKVVRSAITADPYYPRDGYLSVGTDKSNTSFLDDSAEAGQKYYYRICAKDTGGVVYCGKVVTWQN